MKRSFAVSLVFAILTTGLIIAMPGPAQAHCSGSMGLLPDAFLHPEGHADGNEDGLADSRGSYGDGDGVMRTWGEQLTLVTWCRIWHDQELLACNNATCLSQYSSVGYWCCQEWLRADTALNAGSEVRSQTITWGGLNPFAGQCYFMWSYFGTTSNHQTPLYKHRYGDHGARSPWLCRV